METPKIDTSFLKQVDGSSSWSLSKTSVIASVTGPIEAKSRDEIPTSAIIDLVVRPAIGSTCTFCLKPSRICQKLKHKANGVNLLPIRYNLEFNTFV